RWGASPTAPTRPGPRLVRWWCPASSYLLEDTLRLSREPKCSWCDNRAAFRGRYHDERSSLCTLGAGFGTADRRDADMTRRTAGRGAPPLVPVVVAALLVLLAASCGNGGPPARTAAAPSPAPTT